MILHQFLFSVNNREKTFIRTIINSLQSPSSHGLGRCYYACNFMPPTMICPAWVFCSILTAHWSFTKIQISKCFNDFRWLILSVCWTGWRTRGTTNKSSKINYSCCLEISHWAVKGKHGTTRASCHLLRMPPFSYNVSSAGDFFSDPEQKFIWTPM